MYGQVNASTAELLGGFRLTIHARPVTNWRAGKSRALFQYLLVHQDRVITRDRLRETLWPHLPASAGTTSVKAAVHGARSALRTVPGQAPPVEIRAVGGGYLLHGGGLWTDVGAFTRRLNAANAADRAGDRVTAADSYQRAMAVYRGPFLPEQDADWAVEQREWLRTLALRALRFLGQQALDAGDDWTAIEWHHRVLDVDPHDPGAYAVLTDCHRRLGLTTQAERWDHLAHSRLADA